MKEWMNILLRSAGLFGVLFVLIRVMGKRNLSRMNAFQLVNYIVIAVIAALISLRVIANLAFGMIALSVWVIFPILMELLVIKSKWVHDWVHGKETVLIKQGKIMEENLLQMRLTGEELLRDLRSKNVFNVGDVEFAVMESTGDINILLKSDRKPVTPHDLGQKVAPRSEPQTVILDGNIMDEPLSAMGLNRGWLKQQLEGMGLSQDNVFLAQVDSSGDLYVDLFDDSVQMAENKEKELLYAALEKNQADLMSYSLETEDLQAKDMYTGNAEQLALILEKLKPYLLR